MKNRVIIAESQGFCMGVRRAIDAVQKYEKASILGELIHNRHVVEELEKANKRIISEFDGTEDEPIVISAHGARIDILNKLRNLGREILDTTCPFVTNIYKKGLELEQDGYQVLIIGDRNHVEVQGIISRLQHPIVVDSKEELDSIDLPKRVGVICQSTCLSAKFEHLSELIRQRVEDARIVNTICHATLLHQEGARELAQEVDLMIVVGSYNSSNTRKLTLLTANYVETYQVNGAEEVREEWLVDKNIVGIAAGASTPDIIIEAVRHRISDIQEMSQEVQSWYKADALLEIARCVRADVM